MANEGSTVKERCLVRLRLGWDECNEITSPVRGRDKVEGMCQGVVQKLRLYKARLNMEYNKI